MNIIALYNDFSIPYQTEGHKHENNNKIFCFINHLGYICILNDTKNDTTK